MAFFDIDASTNVGSFGAILHGAVYSVNNSFILNTNNHVVTYMISDNAEPVSDISTSVHPTPDGVYSTDNMFVLTEPTPVETLLGVRLLVYGDMGYQPMQRWY